MGCAGCSLPMGGWCFWGSSSISAKGTVSKYHDMEVYSLECQGGVNIREAGARKEPGKNQERARKEPVLKLIPSA